MKWMEGYTGILCPFREYGMVVLPGYQFGGMEHPGAIQMSDRRIFLERHATQEEQLTRLEQIAHETAHLWFGDLVSLKWFEDVWMKEVLSNFMASKITRRSLSRVDHDLNFLRTFQDRAMAIDRTDGTHPIAQELSNLNHASMLYDNIIYDKAPVMMRMLESIMGAPELQNGLQKYLKTHLFGNASWKDLIDALDEAAPAAGVRQFCEVWVGQKGMPTIHTTYKNGNIIISQTDPYNRGLVWPQKFQVRLIYDLDKSRTLTVDMQKPSVSIKVGKKPNYIIPNFDGRGYGHFTLDEGYTLLLPKRLMTTRSDLHRYALLLTIHDNYLLGTARGLGGLAAFDGTKWCVSSNWVQNSHRIIAQGPIRCSFEISYAPWCSEKMERRRVTFDRGQPFCKMEAFIDSIPTGTKIGPGLDISEKRNHAGVITSSAEDGWIANFEPKDGFMGSIETAVVLAPEHSAEFVDSPDGCRMLLSRTIDGKLTWYIGSGWDLAGYYRTSLDWGMAVKAFSAGLRAPLNVTISE